MLEVRTLLVLFKTGHNILMLMTAKITFHKYLNQFRLHKSNFKMSFNQYYLYFSKRRSFSCIEIDGIICKISFHLTRTCKIDKYYFHLLCCCDKLVFNILLYSHSQNNYFYLEKINSSLVFFYLFVSSIFLISWCSNFKDFSCKLFDVLFFF